ncbi:caspase family protein [Neorhizobium petrolearium]|uniref:caspase family protein n=1 Tax=Neorhizobium petrolearium TaxID=515361 RepID=UPI003F7E4FD3
MNKLQVPAGRISAFSMSAVAALLALFLAFLPAGAKAQTNLFQDAGQRVALVIGISDYVNVPALANPVNDAGIIGKALSGLRFDVIAVNDPDRAQLQAAMAEFVQKLDGADIAVFFYAGHAIQVDSTNYLVPTDAALTTIKDIGPQLISLSSIVNDMDRLAKTKIVVLDACRNNPFEDALRGDGEDRIGRGLAVVEADAVTHVEEHEGFNTYGSIIAFSAAAGTTATDGEGANSPYTAALSEQLVRPGIEVGQMFRTAAANVMRETAGLQRPEYIVRLTDEVYFSRPQPSDCDYFAIAPYNQVGIPGVEFDSIKPARAIAACQEALEAEPEHPRFLHNLGRAYDAASDYGRAVEYYRRSSDLGYVPAYSTLGVMYINGQGTGQDFVEGVRLLKHAAGLGYRLSKVALRNQDFSVLFHQKEFERLQSALKTAGYYNGKIDGDFGSGSKRALEEFQKAEGLALNGATLETLDRLSLLETIPHYDLN